MQDITDWGTLIAVLTFLFGVLGYLIKISGAAFVAKINTLIEPLKDAINGLKSSVDAQVAEQKNTNKKLAEHDIHFAKHDAQIDELFSRTEDK
ncbi:hypothetical protein [Periweissella fabalis]|uniref:Uncharacterized protein n=1 Tax=Periweissella fabalis TaxID=1070421 RepID=A0A7X6N5I3_9LACO|nr:hypothetical protein [Periweissella fabalis]MCM0598399.1 hypothetical protein [Periweissella fabalis]NKZ25019.1 hypothetical protein [Periweissella fabalis]